jgi:hypothetical protein
MICPVLSLMIDHEVHGTPNGFAVGGGVPDPTGGPPEKKHCWCGQTNTHTKASWDGL